MKIFSVILVFSLSFFSAAFCQKKDGFSYVKVAQFKIANITLGSTLEAAEKTFGKPDSIEAIYSKIDSVEELLYYFNGVTALVSNDRISRLECINPKYKTPQAIKVGDKSSRLFSALGKSEVWKVNNHKEVHYPLWPPCDTYMIFELSDGLITKITLDYVP
jgi:hypothetical protein